MEPFIRTEMTLLSRTYITGNVIEAKFELDDRVHYEPGQFANILVAENTWRSYSIVDMKQKFVTFLVDIRPGGPGSIFFKSQKYGQKCQVVIPMGKFGLTQSEKPKLFVATGVGIAPFIPMITKLLRSEFKGEVMLLWGIRMDSDMYLSHYLGSFDSFPNFTFIPCLTKSSGEVKSRFDGRVTSFLSLTGTDLSGVECFVCGNRGMVDDVMRVIRGLGATDIAIEKY